MSYTFRVRVYQSDTSVFFSNVERVVWNYANGGTWIENADQYILTIGGSGTSGALRFKSDTGEEAIFVFGIDDNQPWIDLVPDAPTGESTATIVISQYYNDGWRSYQRENHLREWDRAGPGGRNFTVKYTAVNDHDLQAVIIIG